MFGPWSRLALADALPVVVKPWSDLAVSQDTVAAIRRDGLWRPATLTWVEPT